MNQFLKINAELWRSFKTDLSATKLLIFPIIVGLAIFSMSSGDMTASQSMNFLMFALYGSLFLYGSKQASDAIVEEVNAKTWDAQRLLPHTPTRFTLSKLFGGTLTSWYCTFLVLVGYLFFWKDAQNQSPHLILELLSTLLFGVGIQATVMMVSLLDVRARARKLHYKSFLYLLLGIILSFFVFNFTDGQFEYEEMTSYFFSYPLKAQYFGFLVSVFASVLAVLGLRESIRRELSHSSKYWVWLVSVVVGSLVLAAISMLKKNEVSHLEVLYYLQKNFAYFLVLSLVVTTVSFRSLDRSIGAIKRLDFLNTHYWLLPMFLFVASSIYLIFAKSNDLEYGNSISLYTGVILFLVLRDVFVYLHFSIAKNIKRPISFFLFYAFFVYFLLPLVLKGIAFALDLPWAKSLLDFKSIGNEFPLVSLISYALQSLVAFGVLFLSYRKHRQWALTVEESRE